MRIAVIDHFGNRGGSSRVIAALLPAIKASQPDCDLVFFGNKAAIKRENLEEIFLNHNIQVEYLSNTKIVILKILSSNLYQKIRSKFTSKFSKNTFSFIKWVSIKPPFSLTREIRKRTEDFDLLFFPWPFHLDWIETSVPSVAIFHDFNHKYYFSGGHTFSQSYRDEADANIYSWLRNCTPIVSSKFIKQELLKFYPEIDKDINVIHLPQLTLKKKISADDVKHTLEKLGVANPYVLCPTHLVSHKNLGPLLSAIHYLDTKHIQVSLVLTGAGTETLTGCANKIGLELSSGKNNVQGLGYVSSFDIDCLISGAECVINPSLYEAGNGPGVDAWSFGVPVAMSAIPAFEENIEVLDVRAQLFDPRSPIDIATKIEFILSNPQSIQKDVMYSKAAMERNDWGDVARKYINVFESTADKHN